MSEFKHIPIMLKEVLELLGGIFLFTGHHISSGAHSGGDSCTGENGRKVHCHNNHS